MLSRVILIVSLGLWAAALNGAAAEPVVESSQLPRIPPTEPDKAPSTFRVKPGFQLELAAAEPLVVDPIALSFDEDGRCYVVEMRDYSERRPERLGRIRRLEDTDGDGRFDKSTVFAQDLPWPTAVICWAGGVFVGSTPDLLYFKDTTGDGVADVRETIFSGFAADFAPFATNKLNVQALFNSFNWSLDNRIHGATAFNGGKVKPVDSPFVRAWRKRAGVAAGVSPAVEPGVPPGGSGVATPSASQSSKPSPGGKMPPSTAGETPSTTLDLRGRDFSFDPRTLEMRAESGGGQYGMSFDNRGRKYVCSNSSHIQALMYEERHAARHPLYPLPRALLDIAVDGGAAPVFRLSPDEPWRVLRTQWRVAGLVPGPVEGGGKPSGYFTGATGITIYRGDAYGPDLVGDAFVGDAGGNLVHRKKVLPEGPGVKAVRPADEQKVEFLASTDNWFRPVQMANAPDGCLYICDMYREVIEHPWSLPESIKKHLDLNSGNDRGRLYRVVPANFQPRPLPALGKASPLDLAKFLEHPNGWHRDAAARLIYERQDRAAVPVLSQIARSSSSAEGRLHALHALHGLKALPSELVEQKFTDPAPSVRQHAVRLAEDFLIQGNVPPQFVEKLAPLTRDPDSVVVLQLAFTASLLPQAGRLQIVEDLLRNNPDAWVTAAALASLGDAAPALFAKFARENGRGAERVLPGIARLLGLRNRSAEISRAIDLLPAPGNSWVSLNAIAELAEGLDRAGGSIRKAVSAERLAPYFSAAREWAVSSDTDVAATKGDPQGAAMRLLAFAPYEEAAPLFALLHPAQPADLQSKALAALGRQPGATFAEELLKRWPELSPSLRIAGIELLTKRPERIRLLLKAVERGAFPRTELSAAQQSFLRSHRDKSIREEALRVLGAIPTSSRQALVAAFQAALSLPGDSARGRATFLARCATCHKSGPEGHALGPDLATVKNAGKEKILVNILDPNREVNSNYLGYAVETKDGEGFVGLIAGENASQVTLRMAGGTEVSLPRGNIASLQGQGRSIMPEGLEEGLSPQDMADLLEFIVAAP